MLLLCAIGLMLVKDTVAQNRPFGLGVILGSPTGISFKYWLRQDNAWAGGLAWSLDSNESLHIHAEYVWHRFDVIEEPRTALYYGVGGLIVQANEPRLGVRVPFGITHLIRDDPIDFFFELVPVFDLVPETRFDLEGGIGVRYYFGS